MFILSLVIWAGIAFFIYLLMRKDMNEMQLTEVKPYLLIFTFCIALIWFLIFFFAGMYNFYWTRKLLVNVLSLDIFDGNEYSKEYFYEKAFFNFTKECFCGNVNNYPTVLYIHQRISKYSETTINFKVFIIKFNRNTSEQISFPIRLNGQITEAIKKDVMDFVNSIESKGYAKGDLMKGLKQSETNW